MGDQFFFLTEYKGKIIEKSLPIGGGGKGGRRSLEYYRAFWRDQVNFTGTQPKSKYPPSTQARNYDRPLRFR